MKLVSVIVVTYNSSATVIEALDSICNQTYRRVELIVTDDCSNDDTLIVIERWLDTHKNRFESARLLRSNENTGVTKNCNRGINNSNGEYIQVLAGDDLLLPNAIEEKVAFAEQNAKKWFITKIDVFGQDETRRQNTLLYYENCYDIVSKGYKEQVEKVLYYNFIPAPAGSFYDRRLLQESKGYDERYPMMEDYPFLFHYLMAGNDIIMLDKVLIKYRMEDHSLTSSICSPLWKDSRNFFFNERMPELIKRKRYGYVISQTCKYSYQAVKRNLLKLFLFINRTKKYSF